ncbi:MAG: methyl-accepting chemotaxis protein [Candidatus Cloacimonetes bacterium]|nr:methyl-accepting chemotaxis protein [Candidatus Cloacimonadota bacterium]
MSQARPTRSNYFIQAGLQIKFTFVLMMIVLLVATITFFNLYIIGDYVVKNTATIVELRDMNSFLVTVFSIVGWRIILLGVVCFLIICIIGIFYSHQFAGPSYKLEKCLKEISEGNLSFDIKLRTGDALHNVADSINVLVDQFRNVIKQSRALTEEIKEKAESDTEDLQKKQEVLLSKILELEEIFAGYQLTREETEPIDLEGSPIEVSE